MLEITPDIKLKISEIEFTFIRSPGPGGQNVNKVSSAVLLRFNIRTSSLPEIVQEQIFQYYAHKITSQDEILIKATRHRTQLRNKEDAIERLQIMLKDALRVEKKRKKTKPSFASKQKRLNTKKLHGKKKTGRSLKPKNDI